MNLWYREGMATKCVRILLSLSLLSISSLSLLRSSSL